VLVPGAESHITHQPSNRIAILPNQNNYYPVLLRNPKGKQKSFKQLQQQQGCRIVPDRRVQCRVMHLRKSTGLGFQHNLPDLHLFPKKKPMKGIWDICK
jgi:hypothetical protein